MPRRGYGTDLGNKGISRKETDRISTRGNALNCTLTMKNVKKKQKLDKILFDTTGMV